MIGKVMPPGKSFYYCIRYCLEDKQKLSEEQKTELARLTNLQHKNRAEVLGYNKCYGNVRELARQLIEVSMLSKRCEKPILHITLRLAAGEKLSKNQWTDIAEACAKEFKVDQNQYISVLHKDTAGEHIHIVANRVGYDGRAASDSNSYRRMADFCRRMEKEYGLKQVLSPRSFLSKEERFIPRMDERKLALRNAIEWSIGKSHNYQQFEARMKSLGYEIFKGRGIAFSDDKKVRTKGSEVGYSLSTLERIFARKEQQALKATGKNLKHLLDKPQYPKSGRQEHVKPDAKDRQQDHSKQESQDQKADLLYTLMRPEQLPEPLQPHWLKEKKRKKRKGHHL